MISGVAHLKDFDISYRRTTKGGIPIVLSHGIGDNSRCWMPLVTLLEEDFEIVTYDARGHGSSGGPVEGYTPCDYAEDLDAVITSARVAKPILIGHSVGALACLIYTCKYPDRARALVLEDPQPLSRLPTAEFLGFVVSLKAHPIEDLVTLASKRNPNWSKQDVANWATATREVNPNIQNLGAEVEIQWEDGLRCITCPILLLLGTKANGGNFSDADVSAFQELLPQTKVKIISNAGHNVRRDSFDVYRSQLTEFLHDITKRNNSN